VGYNSPMTRKTAVLLLLPLMLCSAAILPAEAETAFKTSAAAADEITYPEMTSDYLILEDLDTGQTLWSVNPDERMYPASMTKMMTEILAIEAFSDTSRKIEITADMLSGLAEANASVAGFAVGDAPTVLDCLYGAALPSGADAVNALAFAVSGSVSAFVDQMNAKAAELGMTHTHFANPTGLFDEDHYSSVSDIALLMKHCLGSDVFRQLIAARQYTTTALASHPAGISLSSTFWPHINNGDGSYSIPGFIGAKTGYTTNAGSCLASTASENGMNLMLVTAHSMVSLGHIRDAQTAYAWAASTFEKKTILTAGDELLERSVQDTMPRQTMSFTADRTVTLDLPQNAELTTEAAIPDPIPAPVKEGDVLGTWTIRLGDQVLYTQQLTASESIARNPLAYAARIISAFVKAHPLLALFYAAAAVFLVLLLVRAAVLSKRRRRRAARRRKAEEKRRRTRRSMNQ